MPPAPPPQETYYSILEWTYPSGDRSPLGFELSVYPDDGTPNNPTWSRQKTFNGYIHDVELVLNNVPQGSYTDIDLSGGYGALAEISFTSDGNGNVSNLTVVNSGSNYRLNDVLMGSIGDNQIYIKVTQLGFKMVYTHDYASGDTFKWSVRSVFPNGRSAWTNSPLITVP
jgi:hypothetical protein